LDYVDFGRYLTQQRELRGLSREEVAQKTRIPDSRLAALETGKVEALPDRVFVIAYIRAYAKVIGLAEDEAILRFEEIDQTVKAVPPVAAQERTRRARAWLQLTFWLGLAALLTLGWLIGTGRLHLPPRH
jgi:cytoskeletal protein RodZ